MGLKSELVDGRGGSRLIKSGRLRWTDMYYYLWGEIGSAYETLGHKPQENR